MRRNNEHSFCIPECVGKTTVTIKVDGVEAGKVAVTAKKNASDETVTITGLEENVVVGKTYTVLLPRKGVDSDERRLTIEGATVTEKADAPRQYEVVFPEEKEYTVVAEAFQSKKLDKATGTAKCVVKAAKPAMQSVEQISLTKFVVNFDTVVKGIYELTDLKPTDVSYTVADTVVPYSILKSVDYTEDGTGMVVEVYQMFRSNVPYTVDFNGVQKSFVACANGLKDVTQIVIKEDTVVYGDYAAIKYAYLNAVGIDITAAVKPDYPASFEFVTDSNDAIIAGDTILFFEVGKTATVKATLVQGYDEANDYAEIKVVSEPTTLTSVKAKEAERVDIVYAIRTDDPVRPTAWNWNGSHEFKIEDDAKLGIYFKYLNVDGKTYSYKTMVEEGVVDVQASDENYLVVSSVAHIGDCACADHAGLNDGYVELKGIKASSAQTLILYKHDDVKNENYPWRYVTVEVKPARKLTTVTLTTDKTKVNTSIDDVFKVLVTPKDQYGDFYDKVTNLEIKQLDNSKKAVGEFDFTSDNLTKTTINNVDYFAATYHGNDFTPLMWSTSIRTAAKPNYVGNIIFSVSVNENASYNGWNKVTSNNASFTIASKGGVAVSLVGKVAKNDIDLKFTKDSKTADFKSAFSVEGNKDGFNTGALTEGTAYMFMPKSMFTGTNLAALKAVTANSIAASSFAGLATYNENPNANTREVFFYTITTPDGLAESKIGDNFISVTDGAIAKAKTGTYTYTLYKAVIGPKATSISPVNTATIRVTDTQPAVSFKLVSDETDVDMSDATAVANDVVDTIDYCGKKYDTLYDAVAVASANNSLYIKSAKIHVESEASSDAPTGYVEVTVTINKLINGSHK